MSANIFSTESLINWISKQDPYAMYDYGNCRKCLIARYFKDMGFRDVHVDGTMFRLDRHSKSQILPEGWDRIGRCDKHPFLGSRRVYTFGEALDTARRIHDELSAHRRHGGDIGVRRELRAGVSSDVRDWSELAERSSERGPAIPELRWSLWSRTGEFA